MKGIKIKTLAVLCAVGMSTGAQAAEGPLVPEGWYVEGNLGVTKTGGVSYGTGTSVSSTGAGFNINGGYKFMPYFATELGYTKYADANVKNAAGGQALTVKHYAFNLAGKGMIPIGCFDVFAKIGAAVIKTQTNINNASAAAAIGPVSTGTNNKTGFYLGAGVDYAFHPNIPISLQWNRAAGGNSVGYVDLISIGIAYIF